MPELRAYEVTVTVGDYPEIVHAATAAKAKYKRYLSFKDAGWDIEFKHLRCRSLGLPKTSAEFKRTAKYRGVEFAEIGMRVQVGPDFGVLVKNNASANFDVLFESGKWAGQELNCHPNWDIKYFAKDGSLIKEFPGYRKEATDAGE
jgi:hypothetical protein